MQNCPKCGSKRLQSRGTKVFCHDCRGYSTVPTGVESKSIEEGNDYINIVCSSSRIRSEDDAIREFGIDLNEWSIAKCKIKTSEGYRKDRKVDWKVRDGKVKKGDVKDTGKMLVVPMFHIELRLVRKTEEVHAREAIRVMVEDSKKHVPFVPRKVKPIKDGLIYEVDFPDLHFGKLTWDKESGDDYDIDIARDLLREAVSVLVSRVGGQRISRILLPFGNDFFNVDNMLEETTHGTRQQEDTRWQKTFRAGRQLATEIIDGLASIAPVDVVVVPGNHDEERVFYLGDSLESFYHRNKNVNIDNTPPKRKYYTFGKVMIGLTHGYHEKLDKLPFIMPIERPAEWATSVHREWHLGDKHHRKDLLYRTEDINGVTIRLLRSLSATDTWHFDKGYVGAPRGAEAFLWHPNDGLIAQYHFTKEKK